MDRISNLPDHLITHIVTFLPIEEAIRTSILSSKWRNIWKGINRIKVRGSEPELDKFTNLVDHILNNCTSTNFVSFELSCPSNIDMSRLNAWTRRALTFNIEELSICYCPLFEGFFDFVFPVCNFACNTNTLVTLKLYSCFDICISESTVCFPCLKSLEICVILPKQASVLHQLLSSCPVLEELSLDGLLFPGAVRKFKICVPTLKNLIMCLDYRAYESHDKVVEHVITINTPNLEYLFLKDDTLSQYVVKNLSSLRHAEIFHEPFSLEGIKTMHINSLLELLKAITTTELLTLSYPTIDVLESALDNTWPTFPDLMMLDMYFTDPLGWTYFPDVLQTAPNLQVLILNLEGMNMEPWIRQPEQWPPPETVPKCLLQHIQVIGIKCFQGNQDELEAIEYLLKNARVLERMLIGYYPHRINEEVMEKLLTIPTAYENCSVEFYDHIFYQTDLAGSRNKIHVWGI